MAVVGSAEIVVRAITKGIKKDINKAFKDLSPTIKAQGDKLGKDFADSFGKSLNAHLGAQVDNAVTNATKSANTSLTDGIGQAGTNAGKAGGRGIDDELSRAGRRGGRSAGKNFFQEFGSILKKDLAASVERLLFISNLFDILAPAIGVAVAGLSSLVSGFFALAVAAGQAAGAIAVIPSLIAAAGQAFGAIKLAFGGIGQAIGLGAKAQDATAAATSGTNQLTKATNNLTAAQKAAREAEKALEDARNRAQETAKNAAQARRDLAKAEKAYAKAKADPDALPEDVKAAEDALKQAQQAYDYHAGVKERTQKRLKKAREEDDKAQAKLKKAQDARDKAASPAAKAVDAFQNALAALTPEARAFVLTVLDMKKRFKELGEEIGKKLFPKLTDALNLLSDSSFFDILKKNLTRTGTIVGNMAKGLAEAFTTDANQKRFAEFLNGNNEILSKFNKVTEDGTTPAQSLVNIFLKLSVAVQPLTKRFATFFAKVITGFDKAHSVADFSKAFKKSGNVAAQLGRIVKNLFKAFGILGRSGRRSGRVLLKSFEDSTKQFKKFSKRVRDDGSAKEYFNGVKRNVRKIGDLFVNIGEEFGALGDNKGVSAFSKSMQPGIDALGDLLDKLSNEESGDALGRLFTSLIELVDELTQNGQLESFLNTLDSITKGAVKLAKKINSIPGIGKILAGLAIVRAAGFAAQIIGLGNAFKFLRNGIVKAAAAPFKFLGKQLKGVAGKTTIGQKFTQTGGKHKTLPSGPTEAEGKALGVRVGKAIGDGIVIGLRSKTKKVIKAINELSNAAVSALKKRLGIKSPSTVFAKLGKNTGDGYVAGLRAKMKAAFRAGQDLGTSAAAGARSVPVTAGAAGAAGAKSKGGGVVPVGAVSAGGAKASAASTKGVSKIGKVSKIATAPVRGLTKGLGALSAGLLGVSLPIVALIAGIVLLVIGLKKLYQKSPEFKKFVDGIVSKLKDLGNWAKKILLKYVVPALDNFFKKVNDNMPKIKKVFSTVFGAIGKAISFVVPIITKVLGFILSHWRIFLPLILGPLGIAIALITKYWSQIVAVFKFAIKLIKGYITKVLVPIFKVIWATIKIVVAIAKKYFSIFAKIIKVQFAVVKAIWNKVLKPVFFAVVDTVKEKFAKAKEYIETFKKGFSVVSDKMKAIGGKIKDVFTSIKDAVTGAFTGLVEAIKTPIRTVIDFLNEHLISPLNTVTSKFGLDIPKIPGFAEGGYTGPGSKYQVAGVVHADEFVISKSARRSIENTSPGLLDRMNRTGKISFGTGGFGPLGDIAGGVAGLAGQAVGGIKDIGEEIAKKGIGKVLETMVSGVQAGLSAAGIKRGGFINDFMYGVLDKLTGAVKSWGGKDGKGALGGGPWGKPFAGNYGITQYANKGHNPSNAIDFGLPDGTAVLAASGGRVALVADKGSTSYGKYMVLDHGDGVKSLYAHLQAFTKHVGNSVTKGMQIGLSGHTGGVRSNIIGSTGAHLHFEINPSSDTLAELRKRGVKFATGGVAKATSGGILSVIAEAGKNERVEPLDSDGMSKRDKEIMKKFAGAGNRNGITINVSNPSPERASVSVSKVLRSKAIEAGWTV